MFYPLQLIMSNVYKKRYDLSAGFVTLYFTHVSEHISIAMEIKCVE